MKIAVAFLFLIAVPVAAAAQTQIFLDDRPVPKDKEDFTASADLSGRYFVQTNIPNRMLDDYTNYKHVPGEQMDLLVRGNLLWGITLDVEPYAWIGTNQWVSRIGLIGEVKYETPLEWITVGYGHHSWHNIDVDIAKYYGHQQDWLLARFDLPRLELGEKSFLRFSVEPYWFVGSKEPILVKTAYGPGEEHAFAMAALPIVGAVHDFNFEVKPYIQFGNPHRRYGVSSELVYNLTEFFAGFVSVEYFNTNGTNRDAIGIGIMLRLKR